MASINLSEETMSRVITKALLEELGQEEKDRIIAQAVAYLAEPYSYEQQRRSVTGAKTPLQDAFNLALDQYVNRVVRSYIEDNAEVQATVTAQLTTMLAAYKDQLTENYDLGSKVAEAIGNYFIEKARDRW